MEFHKNIREEKSMETISIQASAPSRLDKIMSIAGCHSGDAGTENVDFAGIKTSDTPILFNGRSIGTVPRHAIMTFGDRIRASHGKLSDRSILPMLGSQLFSTGCTLEVLKSSGGIIEKSVLKSFNVSSAGEAPQAHGIPTPTARTDAARLDDEDALVDRIFSKTRGCGSHFQSEQQKQDRLKTKDSRTDDAIADAIFIRSGGGDQRDPGGAARTQQPGTQSEDDAMADRLFAASGGR